jgi:proton-translocating NADH-quinone oxidoreductase chain N
VPSFDLGQTATLFLPELILVVGALVVLGYDLVVRGRDALQPWLTLAALLVALGATLWLYTVPPGAIFEVRDSAGTLLRPGAFVSDGFTNFFRLISLITTSLVLLSGITFMRSRTPFKGEFYALLLCGALAMDLMAGANDLIMIALSIEFLSITSYVLTAYLRQDPLSSEAGLKYFLYGSITSAAMLFGLSLLFGVTGQTSLPAIGRIASDPQSLLVTQITTVALPALVLILAGIGFKIALVPFHQWSPDAYQGAPTPVTAFLSIGPKAAGFAVMLRLLTTAFSSPEFAPSGYAILAGIALLTMLLGNITALLQTNVKRMMAYSSIAQAGYMLIGVVSFGGAMLAGISPLGSVLIYILAYLFTNMGAFAAIIAVDHATGSSELPAYAGLIRRAPFLAVSLFIFFLSLVGIPPLAGFIGKFAVFSAAVTSGQTMLAVVGVLTGVIAVGYYFRVVKEMFFGQAPEDAAPLRTSGALRFVVVVALVMSFAIFLFAGSFLELANTAAAALQPLAETVAGR